MIWLYQFDCSLSHSHLPETAATLKPQNIATLFIVLRQICDSSTERGMIAFGDCSWSLLTSLGAICHKWQLLFCAGIVLGHCTALSTVFSKPFDKMIICHPFMVSKVNAYSEWIWCTETLIKYPMYLFWHDRVWRHYFVTWVGKWHHSTFFLKLVSCALIWYKMSHLRRRQEILRANQCDGNLAFISINVSFRETVPLKTFPWIFPHPNFIKKTITFDVSNSVNVSFVRRVLQAHPAFKVLLQFLYLYQVLLNFFV